MINPTKNSPARSNLYNLEGIETESNCTERILTGSNSLNNFIPTCSQSEPSKN